MKNDIPSDGNDKIYEVPRISQIRFLMENKSHCNDLKNTFQYKYESKSLANDVQVFIPIGLKVSIPVVYEGKHYGITYDEDKNHIVKPSIELAEKFYFFVIIEIKNNLNLF